MGVVYQARDAQLQRLVAVKVLSPTWLSDEVVVARFEREARTIASLRHEAVIKVYDVGRAGPLHYFVMDFIEGVSLSRLLKVHGPLPIPVVRAILYQVGSALDYAHRPGRGIVHRDVKPSNIMLDVEGLAVVMDFGISRVSEAPSGLTRTGLVFGTPEFMSPEQCRGHTVTHASDQYSLGAVTYAMLTGAPPFTGPFYSVLMAHDSKPPAPVLSGRPDCPAELASAAERMLAKPPDHRWPSIGDALKALDLRPVPADHPAVEELGRLVASAVETSEEHQKGPDATVVSQPEASSPTPTSMEIGPLPGELEVGDELVLEASTLFEEGSSEGAPDLTWESTDPAIAKVDSESGQLVAVGVGSAVISVETGGLRESVAVAVRAPKVIELAITPDSVELEAGQQVQLSAQPLDKLGKVHDRPVSWSSSDPRILTIDEGLVTAQREGAASILANCEGVGATAAVRISPASEAVTESTESVVTVAEITVSGIPDRIRVEDTVQLAATPLDEQGRPVEAAVVWKVAHPGVLEVLGGGRFKAIAQGRGVVLVESEAVTKRVPLRVLPSATARPVPTEAARRPSTADSPPVASARGRSIAAATSRAVGWVRERPAHAAVAVALAVVTMFLVRAMIGPAAPVGIATDVVVINAANGEPIGSALRLTLGETVALEAAVFDEQGTAVDRTVDWSSSSPSVASIDPTGVLVGLGGGGARLEVASGDVVREIEVTVEPPVAEIVVVTAADQQPVDSALLLDPGQSVVLGAHAQDESGARVIGPDVSWTSSDASVAEVDGNGRVTALSTGETSILAASADVAREVAVIVAVAALAPSTAAAVQPQPVADQPEPEPPPEDGLLRLIVRPWAFVYVDGSQRGDGDERNLEMSLAPGSHQLRLENPNMVTFDTTFVVVSGQPTVVTKQLQPGNES